MKILKRVSGLQGHLKKEKSKKKKIGFVPTMGALHAGHMSLVTHSVLENDVTVTSVFVNPTQFNQKDDLEKYPRDLKKDATLLKDHDNDFLFAPSISQIYPKDIQTKVDLDISHLTQSMEGPNRPGHFEGVVQVVYRLLEIVKPDSLYMGQKDFQQFTIIDYMINALKIKTKLRVIPIARDTDGLALSSRNVRLSKKLRPSCNVLYNTLLYAHSKIGKMKVSTIEKKAMDKLRLPSFKPEYFSIMDGHTLQPVKDAAQHDYIVACTAVWVGKVRLIDNMILKK